MRKLVINKLVPIAAVAALAAAGPAQAGTAACGVAPDLSLAQIETTATCQSWGYLLSGDSTPDTQTWGVNTTVGEAGSGGGELSLLSFGGDTYSKIVSKPIPQGTITYSTNILDAATYLLFVFETGNLRRDWMVVTALGSELKAGIDYVEADKTGTAKYDLSIFSLNPVSSPASLALLSLGLAAAALMGRRSRQTPAPSPA